MSKPSWDDAPKWAQYLALDGDGRWYWYEQKPTYDTDYNWWTSDRCTYACKEITPENSLEKRP